MVFISGQSFIDATKRKIDLTKKTLEEFDVEAAKVGGTEKWCEIEAGRAKAREATRKANERTSEEYRKAKEREAKYKAGQRSRSAHNGKL